MAHNTRDLLKTHYGDSLPSDDNSSDVTVGTAAVNLVNANARRVKLRLCNFGGANVVIERDSSVTATKGIQLSPGQTVEFNWDEDLEDVARAWFAISAFAGNSVHIIETILTGQNPAG